MINKYTIKEVARQKWRDKPRLTVDDLMEDDEILYTYEGKKLPPEELRDLCVIPSKVEDKAQWQRRDYWPHHVAVCLLFDVNPDVYFYCPTDIATSIRTKIKRLLTLLKDAIAANKIKTKDVENEVCINKNDWLQWITGYTDKNNDDWIETFIDQQWTAFTDDYFPEDNQPGSKENVGLTRTKKSRAAKKEETEQRYLSWQEEIDKLNHAFPKLSHMDLCKKLSKEIGVSPDTIRRQTVKKKKT